MPRKRRSRRIIVYIAASADGFIARSDGDVEWLNRRPRTLDYGIGAFYRSIDTILWGRKTYDWVLDYHRRNGIERSPFDPRKTNLVFSRTPPRKAPDRVEFVSEPIDRIAARLRASPGKDVWLMGGAELIASFLDAGEIDELDVHVIPILIGEGIPLIAPRRRDVPLTLVASQRYPDGVVRMRYRVGGG